MIYGKWLANESRPSPYPGSECPGQQLCPKQAKMAAVAAGWCGHWCSCLYIRVDLWVHKQLHRRSGYHCWHSISFMCQQSTLDDSEYSVEGFMLRGVTETIIPHVHSLVYARLTLTFTSMIDQNHYSGGKGVECISYFHTGKPQEEVELIKWVQISWLSIRNTLPCFILLLQLSLLSLLPSGLSWSLWHPQFTHIRSGVLHCVISKSWRWQHWWAVSGLRNLCIHSNKLDCSHVYILSLYGCGCTGKYCDSAVGRSKDWELPFVYITYHSQRTNTTRSNIQPRAIDTVVNKVDICQSKLFLDGRIKVKICSTCRPWKVGHIYGLADSVTGII